MRGFMRAILLYRGPHGPRDDCPGCPSTSRPAPPILPACLAVAALAAPFDRDVDAALARIAHHAERAREQGARLLVLPESALGGYLREPGPDEMRARRAGRARAATGPSSHA